MLRSFATTACRLICLFAGLQLSVAALHGQIAGLHDLIAGLHGRIAT
jgi:hypothetical protein